MILLLNVMKLTIIMLVDIKSISTISDNEMSMIVDVVNSFEKPSDIVIDVCWQKSVKLNLMKKLGIQHAKRTRFIQNHQICQLFSNEKILIMADSRCPNFEDTLITANSCYKFKHPNRWFITGGIQHNKVIPHEFNNINIMIDAEIIISQQFNNIFKIYMPYKIGILNNGWILENFGTWERINGLNKSKSMNLSKTTRRKDLFGEPITISVIITDNRTKSELLEMRNIHRDSLTKAGFLQYLPIYDFMNATKVIIYADTWGYLINGTFNGMVGHIARGEAELGGTVVFITKERLSVLNFLNYPSSPSVMIVFREPSLSYEHNLFLLPFKPLVWCCIAGLVVILIFILFINARWENVKSPDNDKINHTILKPDISDVVILVMSAISQQGSPTELKGTLGRVVMLVLFSSFLFLYTSYSASIVALLQSSSSGIRTLADLLNSRLDLGVEDTPYNRHYFPFATEPVRKAIYQNKIAPHGMRQKFMALEDGVRKLQKEPFAFNMNTGPGYRLVEQYFYEHEKCDLREISYISNTKAWQTSRKDSPYKEIFKIGSLRSQEHGFNTRANKLVFSKKPMCITKVGNFSSVNMIDFYPALLVLLYGMILAIIILFLETLVNRRLFPLPYKN